MCDLLMPSDFQLLFEATPHPYLILRPDAAFTIVAVNDRYLAATGTQRSAIVGHGVFDIFPENPDDASGGSVSDLRASLNRVVTDRHPDVMGVQKYDIPRRDGSGEFEVRYWSPVNTPVFGPAGDLRFITHHVEDVTEFILSHERASQESAERILKVEARVERSEAEVLLRAAELKEANRALKRAKEELERRAAELARLNEQLQEQDRLKDVSLARALHRLDAHIENSPLAAIEFDPAFRVTRWSKTAEQLFGWRADEIVGRALSEIRWVHQDDLKRVTQVLAEMRSGISPRNKSANRNYRKDGSVIQCEWYNSALYDGHGNLVSILSQALDVTEREGIADKIRASEEKYRTLFANMSEGFALGEPILDGRGRPVDYRFLEVNEAFYEQTGIPRGIVGRPLREALPQLEQTWTDRYAAAVLEGQSARIESYNADTQRYHDTYCFCPSPGRFAILFRDITERKRVEQALLDSKQSLALALRAGGSAAWELDVVKGKMVAVDEMLYAMVGYAPEELDEPADWISHIHEEDQAAVTRNLTKLFEGKTDSYRQELRFRKKDGQWLWLLSQGVAVERDAGGRATRLLGTNTDIDARKHAEERLKESEEKYRTLFSNMTEGFALGEPILNEQGRVVDIRYLEANEAFYRHTGFPKDILGRPHRDFLPEVEQLWIDCFAAVALTGQPDQIESYSAPTRRHYDVRAFCPSPGRFAILFRDITEQRRIQEALLDSEARYKALFDNKTIAIAHQRIVTDDQGRPVDFIIEAVNDTCERLLHFKREDVVGRPVTETFTDIRDYDFDFIGRFGRVALEGGELEFEAYVPPLGRWFSFYAYSPVRGECTSMFTDITAQKEAEAAILRINADLEQRVAERTRELTRANEALLTSNEELKRFAYIASHDLQTPLRTIMGFSQILQKDYKGRLDERADELIGRIVDGARRLHVLIRDLLAYSRVDSQARPFEPVEFQEVFLSVVSALDGSIREAGAEVTHGDLPQVMGDRSQLTQLLQNLIENGLKYRGTEPLHIHVWAERQPEEWRFSVRDNGIGIDAKHQEAIFEIFRRLHTQQAYPGTGIGLSVCRRVVERHGGRIWVESEPGRGSVFHFTPPIAKETGHG